MPSHHLNQWLYHQEHKNILRKDTEYKKVSMTKLYFHSLPTGETKLGPHYSYRGSQIILSMRPVNERRRYAVTPSLIGWAHTKNDPSDWWFIVPHTQGKHCLERQICFHTLQWWIFVSKWQGIVKGIHVTVTKIYSWNWHKQKSPVILVWWESTDKYESPYRNEVFEN